MGGYGSLSPRYYLEFQPVWVSFLIIVIKHLTRTYRRVGLFVAYGLRGYSAVGQGRLKYLSAKPLLAFCLPSGSRERRVLVVSWLPPPSPSPRPLFIESWILAYGIMAAHNQGGLISCQLNLSGSTPTDTVCLSGDSKRCHSDNENEASWVHLLSTWHSNTSTLCNSILPLALKGSWISQDVKWI